MLCGCARGCAACEAPTTWLGFSRCCHRITGFHISCNAARMQHCLQTMLQAGTSAVQAQHVHPPPCTGQDPPYAVPMLLQVWLALGASTLAVGAGTIFLESQHCGWSKVKQQGNWWRRNLGHPGHARDPAPLQVGMAVSTPTMLAMVWSMLHGMHHVLVYVVLMSCVPLQVPTTGCTTASQC